MKEELFNKNGLAVIKLAREFRRFRPGDRLPRVADLAAEFNLSIGTTQYGLSFLKNKEVVSLVSRGHLGTYIEAINYELLHEYAGKTEKVCVMPLPYSLRYEGLAAAFFELGNIGGKFYVAFMNGSGRRIQALLQKRYDCVLLSRSAAEDQKKSGTPIEIAVSYGPESFLKNHVLVYRGNDPAYIHTLGIDPESRDQVLLAREFLKKRQDVKIVDFPYSRIINRLESGQVDATIWNLDYITEQQSSLKYSCIDCPQEYAAMTEAVLVVRSADIAAADYLASRFPRDAVCTVQQEVLLGNRIPEY